MDINKFIEAGEKRSHQKMDKRLKLMLSLILKDIEKNMKLKIIEEIEKTNAFLHYPELKIAIEKI